MTISSWLNFGGPALPGRGSGAGEIFRLRVTTASAQCLRLSERLFHLARVGMRGNQPGGRSWSSTAGSRRRGSRTGS